MKTLLLILISLFIYLYSFGQQAKNINKYEARDMIALCNSFTQIALYNTDAKIRPEGYSKIYTSGVYGLDNKFQIWKNNRKIVIVFRGSTAKKSSWLENMYSVMIPSKGQIVLPGMDTVDYKFANDSHANTHAGWSLGVAFLIQDLIHEIQRLNALGYYQFVLTGHSQGGALSVLSRAYLENLPDGIISSKCTFKTYAFASPMVGNQAFNNEYEHRYVDNESSFSIYNSKDMVPKMPITIETDKESIISWDNVEKLMDTTDDVTFKSLAFKTIVKTMVKNPSEYYSGLAGDDVYKQIVNTIGQFTMPRYTKDLRFRPLANRINIGPFEELETQLGYGIEESDSLSEETMAYRKQLEKLRGGTALQHKPYNYYLYFLKKYFIEDYIHIIEEERELWNRP